MIKEEATHGIAVTRIRTAMDTQTGICPGLAVLSVAMTVGNQPIVVSKHPTTAAPIGKPLQRFAFRLTKRAVSSLI
jgi:hypothetical protein